MSTSQPIRVMIVDDHNMVRRGLATILKIKADLLLVGEASNGKEALEICERVQPDVILMDLIMPEMGGVAATQIIRRRWPIIQVIALTSFQEKELVREALQAGAISYLLKNVSAEELANAIRAAHAGRPTLAPEAAQVLIKAATGTGRADHGLTNRELEILRLMVDGLSNPEIATKLFVSRSTVKFHVSNILMKLGASSRTEAVSMAIHKRLVE
jgi:NarL family two-component system response regulator LiaR